MNPPIKSIIKNLRAPVFVTLQQYFELAQELEKKNSETKQN